MFLRSKYYWLYFSNSISKHTSIVQLQLGLTSSDTCTRVREGQGEKGVRRKSKMADITSRKSVASVPQSKKKKLRIKWRVYMHTLNTKITWSRAELCHHAFIKLKVWKCECKYVCVLVKEKEKKKEESRCSESVLGTTVVDRHNIRLSILNE